ncbi:MAG: hypothetical protein AB1716_14250 [Planctomycetota bacterium]
MWRRIARLRLAQTARQSLAVRRAPLGPQFRITRERGVFFEHTGIAPAVMATVHPSAILRAPTDAERHAAYAAFVADLRGVAGRLER